MFFMQSASFLAYQRTMEKGHGHSDCRLMSASADIPSTIPSRLLDERRTRAAAALFSTYGGVVEQSRRCSKP